MFPSPSGGNATLKKNQEVKKALSFLHTDRLIGISAPATHAGIVTTAAWSELPPPQEKEHLGQGWEWSEQTHACSPGASV